MVWHNPWYLRLRKAEDSGEGGLGGQWGMGCEESGGTGSAAAPQSQGELQG